MQKGLRACSVVAESFEPQQGPYVLSVYPCADPAYYPGHIKFMCLFKHHFEHPFVYQPLYLENVPALFPDGDAYRDERVEAERKEPVFLRLDVGYDVVQRLGPERGEKVPSLFASGPDVEHALQKHFHIVEVIMQPHDIDKSFVGDEGADFFVYAVEVGLEDLVKVRPA